LDRALSEIAQKTASELTPVSEESAKRIRTRLMRFFAITGIDGVKV